jgi:uncharacterized phage-associated protein
MMSVLSASMVADALLAFCNEHGDLMSNLKLQKLLYYCQGWYLGLNRKPLFGEKLEAWIHGPVVPEVYRSFSKFKHKPIESDLTFESDQLREITSEVRGHITEVWSAYGGFSAYDLERLSHQERPWLEARGGLAPDVPSNNLISEVVMTEFFSELQTKHHRLRTNQLTVAN